MFAKPVNIEGIFNFTFGAGKDENLIVDLTEFLDSKVYAGGDSGGDGDGRSRSSILSGQPEPSAQPDFETRTQASST